jgi:GTP-binding protein EngB required for normal cell division
MLFSVEGIYFGRARNQYGFSLKHLTVLLNPITQGHTKTLNFYQVGRAPGKAVLVDAPGYGGRGRPEWGELFDHYANNRKE